MSDEKDTIIATQAKQISAMRDMINLLALINKEFLESCPEEFHEEPQFQRALLLSRKIIAETGGAPNVSDLIAKLQERHQ